jgi:hypothetical protein
LRTILVALAATLLLLAACGDEEERSTVDVTLSEWALSPNVASVVEGEVTFNADNNGEQEHELVIIQTDFAAGELPTEDNGTVDEDADGVDVVGQTNEIESGDNDSRVFTLDPGKYVLLCNRVSEGENDQQEVHYENGMFSAFDVTEKE